MPEETVTLSVNGRPVSMPVGSAVSAAVMKSGVAVFRRTAGGEPRGPLCGMGVCFECQVTIGGRRRRSCQTECRDGMDVWVG